MHLQSDEGAPLACAHFDARLPVVHELVDDLGKRIVEDDREVIGRGDDVHLNIWTGVRHHLIRLVGGVHE
jgi:hypothetical protein